VVPIVKFWSQVLSQVGCIWYSTLSCWGKYGYTRHITTPETSLAQGPLVVCRKEFRHNPPLKMNRCGKISSFCNLVHIYGIIWRRFHPLATLCISMAYMEKISSFCNLVHIYGIIWRRFHPFATLCISMALFG
jgi:hypothetical protein